MHSADSMVMRVQGLKKYYGEIHAVDDISFDIPKGTVFTVLGPNGAGKTTTLEILEGIREPDGGEIEVFGERVKKIGRAAKERMGVLLQGGNFEPYLRVREVMTLFSSFFSQTVPVSEILEGVALVDKSNAAVRTLSGGQKQRLAVGVALVNDPQLVFLDEPTTGLDPQARRNIWAIVTRLKDQDKTIVLTTHYMEEAEALSDYVCIMDHGSIIAEGSPRELTAKLGQETIVEFAAPKLTESASSSLDAFGKSERMSGDMVSLESEDLVHTMEGLLAWSREHGVPLVNMSVRQPNLEDVFLSLTGRSLRE